MKFCPYCGSDQLIRIDRVLESHSISSPHPLLSPANMSSMVIQLAKGIHVHPVVVSVIGMIAHGVAMLIQEHFAVKKLPHFISMMFCSQCHQCFNCPNPSQPLH